MSIGVNMRSPGWRAFAPGNPDKPFGSWERPAPPSAAMRAPPDYWKKFSGSHAGNSGGRLMFGHRNLPDDRDCDRSVPGSAKSAAAQSMAIGRRVKNGSWNRASDAVSKVSVPSSATLRCCFQQAHLAKSFHRIRSGTSNPAECYGGKSLQYPALALCHRIGNKTGRRHIGNVFAPGFP